MKISQEFLVARPLPAVWSFFKDIPKVAACLPGAEYLGDKGDGKHAGKVTSKIGPFQASFEGEALVNYDDIAHAVHVDGKGVDRKGASRGKMAMDCRLSDKGDSTMVSIDADVQLSGTIAQFGRTGIINEVATLLIADFVRNVEAELAAPQQQSSASASTSASAATSAPLRAKPISGFGFLVAVLKAWFKSKFNRQRI